MKVSNISDVFIFTHNFTQDCVLCRLSKSKIKSMTFEGEISKLISVALSE